MPQRWARLAITCHTTEFYFFMNLFTGWKLWIIFLKFDIFFLKNKNNLPGLTNSSPLSKPRFLYLPRSGIFLRRNLVLSRHLQTVTSIWAPSRLFCQEESHRAYRNIQEYRKPWPLQIHRLVRLAPSWIVQGPAPNIPLLFLVLLLKGSDKTRSSIQLVFEVNLLPSA